jgi:hypothetical protein
MLVTLFFVTGLWVLIAMSPVVANADQGYPAEAPAQEQGPSQPDETTPLLLPVATLSPDIPSDIPGGIQSANLPEETPDAEPLEESPVTQPTEDTPDAEPLEESPVTQPTEDTPDAEPLEESPVTQPTEDTPDAEPLEESPVTQPTDDPPLAVPPPVPADTADVVDTADDQTAPACTPAPSAEPVAVENVVPAQVGPCEGPAAPDLPSDTATGSPPEDPVQVAPACTLQAESPPDGADVSQPAAGAAAMSARGARHVELTGESTTPAESAPPAAAGTDAPIAPVQPIPQPPAPAIPPAPAAPAAAGSCGTALAGTGHDYGSLLAIVDADRATLILSALNGSASGPPEWVVGGSDDPGSRPT